MVVGILGILKAGAAYLPLDPTYPADRLAFMLEDSAIRVLLTQAGVLPRLPLTAGSAIRTLCLDADWPEIAALPDTDPAVPVTAAGLAYCIYTSGSTGRPKGALLAHRGLCNLADEQARQFGMRPGKRVLQFSAFSFDASVWETVMALRSGATLVLAPQETLSSGPDLLKLLRSASITTVTLPPSLLSLLSPSALPDLETVIAAGERCANEIVRQWAPGRRFFNAYGPTETTVCATMRRCDAEEEWPFGGPPIGRPIANFQCYVVNTAGPNLQPQPIGVPGELLVGGAGVARRVSQSPRADEAALYPAAGFLADGRAARLKTGSIAPAILSGGCPAATSSLSAASTTRSSCAASASSSARSRQSCASTPRCGTRWSWRARRSARRLRHSRAAPDGEEAPVSASALRGFLRGRLPEYMVPGVFVTLEAFPLSPAGKVDRRGLPEPDQARREASAEYVAPRTETEIALAAMSAELLGLERVGVGRQLLRARRPLAARDPADRADSRHVRGRDTPARAL